jgi:hypothetical protein
MGNLIHNLEFNLEVALLGECVSTRNLLSYGVKVMREGAFLETTQDPILTMLTIGLEKLHKLALGSLELDRSDAWPDKATMKRYGHGILAMHEALMDELKQRAEGKSTFAKGLLDAVEADQVVPPMLDALDAYGRAGRFYYLDILARAPQDWVGPAVAWTEVELAARQDPTIAELEVRAFENIGDNSAFDALLKAINERIATSVETVWDAIVGCGKNHLMGRAGDIIGHEADPAMTGRQ